MQINRKVRRPDPDPSPVDYCWALSLILLINHLKKSQKDKEIRGNVCRVWLNMWNNVTIDNAKIFFLSDLPIPNSILTAPLFGWFSTFPKGDSICLITRLFLLLLLGSKYLTSDGIEHFFNILVVFSTCFKQLNSHLTGKTLGIFCQDHFPIWHIIFVPHYHRTIQLIES